MGTDLNSCPKCGKPLPVGGPQDLCPRCLMAMNMATQTDLAGEGTKILTPAPLPQDLAKEFPELEVVELLGRGGMGAVYKARQKELDRIVALKILPPGIGDSPGFAERFTREAKALAKLNHANIVTLYEFGRRGGLFFFLMEYVDGVNLRQLLASERVAPREALAIVPQICDALQYAHDQGIVHRDIKPDNILMDRRGRVKVADFGLAKIVNEAAAGTVANKGAGVAGGPSPAARELTEAGKIMGTPNYMAPEQEERPLAVDHRADIYGLGVVFYQMLTGELPGKPIEPPSRKVHIDVRLDEVVLRALEKNPERRYEQASVLKSQVEMIAASTAPGGSADRQPDDNRAETFDRHRFSLKVPAIGLLVAGGVNLLPLVIIMALFCWAMISESGPRIAGFFNVSGVLVSAVGGLLIFAAVQMMRLHHYWLCVSASILAMIIPPGLLLGMPFGIWALVVLGRTEVRKAFDSERRSFIDRATQTGESRRRPGRLIAGLAAAVFALCAGWLAEAYMISRGVAVTDVNRVPQIEQKLAHEVEKHLRAADYDASSVSVRLAPPRYSRGECSIAGLRQFDGPRPTEPDVQRLYVNIHGGGLVRHEGNGLWSFLGNDALQRIRFHIDASQETGAGTKGRPLKETSSGLAPKTDFDATMPDGSFRPKDSFAFGPVIERTVNDDGARENFFIDLDKGTLHTPPAGLSPRDTKPFVEWVRANGIDACGETGAGVRGLVGLDVLARPIASGRWDHITPHDVLSDEVLRNEKAEPTEFFGLNGTFLTGKGELPETYLFKTRESGMGVLQITGFAENPRGVRIRSKLLRRAGGDARADNARRTPQDPLLEFRDVSLQPGRRTTVEVADSVTVEENKSPAGVHKESEKAIFVSRDKFSQIYPAVWFSPATGEIVPIDTIAENPPDNKYEIWIEPRDPEFRITKSTTNVVGKHLGFAPVGKGPKSFEQTEGWQTQNLEANLAKLMRGSSSKGQPVFYCQGKTSACLLMITEWDPKSQIIGFKWKRLAVKTANAPDLRIAERRSVLDADGKAAETEKSDYRRVIEVESFILEGPCEIWNSLTPASYDREKVAADKRVKTFRGPRVTTLEGKEVTIQLFDPKPVAEPKGLPAAFTQQTVSIIPRLDSDGIVYSIKGQFTRVDDVWVSPGKLTEDKGRVAWGSPMIYGLSGATNVPAKALVLTLRPIVQLIPKGQAKPGSESHLPNVVFGPVIERVLDAPGIALLDIETGDVTSLPEAEPESGVALPGGLSEHSTRGMMVFVRDDNWELYTSELFAELERGSWEGVSAADLTKAFDSKVLSGIGIPFARQSEGVRTRCKIFQQDDAPPVDLAFRTGTGQTGVLQIVSFTEQRHPPHQMKIRYKFVQASK